MSVEPSKSPLHLAPPIAQEEEGINYWKIGAVALAAAVTFAIAIAWSTGILNRESRELQPNGPDPIPRQIGSAKIGLVEQVPFDVSRSYANYRAAKLQRLQSWGVVDGKAGTVHMPIDEAIDRMLKEQPK